MAKVDLYNMAGEVVGDYELAEAIYEIEPNQAVLYQVIKAQLANKRQGTSKVKNRSEVRGGGRKPWRQKGTGRARQGSIRSPQWIGGGVVFGPTPRDYSLNIPKKVKRLALKSALSLKTADNKVVVVDGINIETPKTKAILEMLKKLNQGNSALIVVENDNKNAKLSIRNLANVDYASPNTINTYDIVNHDLIILTKSAADTIGEVYL